MKTNTQHIPVLANETIQLLQVEKGGEYIDATLGAGGHTRKITAQGGRVLGLDQDSIAIKIATKTLSTQIKTDKVTLVKDNFTNLDLVAAKQGFDQVDGILFDLGVSSMQLDDPKRGFSFLADAPLDMRMDQSSQTSAYDLINQSSLEDLYAIIINYSQGEFARQIADAIVRARKIAPIKTTGQLVQVIQDITGTGAKDKIHPATKVFQAIRIAVNSEINNLKIALLQSVKLLKTGGRLIVISFHETEDRVVKTFIKNTSQLIPVVKKPLTATAIEIKNNPRSRSAKLRAAQKVS